MLGRHDGGDLDWYSVDGTGPLPAPATPVDPVGVYPARLGYPGAPYPRWWQIEDAQVDIGGYPPDRSHFATLLLIDLIANHSDDWFTFPIDAAPGHVVTLDEVVVVDSFGDEWALDPPAGLEPVHHVRTRRPARWCCGPPPPPRWSDRCSTR